MANSMFGSVRKYRIRFDGITPLIVHHDNKKHQDFIKKYLKDPANKRKSVPGDDRYPPMNWVGRCYFDAGVLAMPSDNIGSMLCEAGAKCPTGVKQGTFKRIIVGGLVQDKMSTPILVQGSKILAKDLFDQFYDEALTFEEHEARVLEMGFELFGHPAGVNGKKHYRIRPRFDTWAVEFTVSVFDETLTEEILNLILFQGGAYCGLCDWRPSSPKKPGHFGRFTHKLTLI